MVLPPITRKPKNAAPPCRSMVCHDERRPVKSRIIALAMTSRHGLGNQTQLRDLAARSARVLLKTSCPHHREGAGKAGCRLHPWVPCKKSTGVGPQVQPESRRLSPRNGFTAYSALSPVTGLVCHRRRRNRFRQLDASVGASGPHAFAVRLKCIRQGTLGVHRIPLHVRDDRETPLGRAGWPIIWI
jgi:hypothetical protein